MPYRKVNKGYKKRRVTKRKMMRKPLSIRQVRAINTLVNKGRELKRFYSNVIDLNCAPNANVDMEFQPKLASGQPARLGATHVVKGDEPYEREGAQIQPVYFKAKCLIKYLSPSTRAAYDEALVRVVFYHKNSRFYSSVSGSAMQIENGDHTAVPNTISGIWNDFNFLECNPFYDRTFKLTPGQIYDAGEPDIMTTGNNTPQSKMFTVIHKYGPNAKPMTCQGDANGDLFNSKNIQGLMIVRLTNNQTTVSVNTVRLNAQCEFGFRDA